MQAMSALHIHIVQSEAVDVLAAKSVVLQHIARCHQKGWFASAYLHNRLFEIDFVQPISYYIL